MSNPNEKPTNYQPMDEDELIRIMKEEDMCLPPETPDTESLASFRARIREEIAEIKAQGWSVKYP